MAHATLGKPRVKESKGARQARLLRALEHRVRRLEKLARPAVVEQLRYSGEPVDLHALIGEQVLRPLRSEEGVRPVFDPAATFRDAMERIGQIDIAASVSSRVASVANIEAQEALNAALTTGLGTVQFRYIPYSELYAQPGWYRRAARALHWFFLVLPRRALGAVTPSYGVREAGPSLSDDTQ